MSVYKNVFVRSMLYCVYNNCPFHDNALRRQQNSPFQDNAHQRTPKLTFLGQFSPATQKKFLVHAEVFFLVHGNPIFLIYFL